MNGIDSLVSNAGISLHEGSFKNVTESGFDAQFKVNFKAPYFLAKYFVEKIENEKIDFANILFVTSERGSFLYFYTIRPTKGIFKKLCWGIVSLLLFLMNVYE